MIYQIIETMLTVLLLFCAFIFMILGIYKIAEKNKTIRTDICVKSVFLGTGLNDGYFSVGETGVKKIIYHKSSYKGDESYVDVYRENGDVTRYFYFTSIIYEEKESWQ